MESHGPTLKNDTIRFKPDATRAELSADTNCQPSKNRERTFALNGAKYQQIKQPSIQEQGILLRTCLQ